MNNDHMLMPTNPTDTLPQATHNDDVKISSRLLHPTGQRVVVTLVASHHIDVPAFQSVFNVLDTFWRVLSNPDVSVGQVSPPEESGCTLQWQLNVHVNRTQHATCTRVL